MKQASLFSNETPSSCVLTGHRTLGADFSEKQLFEELTTLLNEGITTFYCGMAIGFDMTAASCLLSLKKKYNSLKIIACIPCEGQEKYYEEKDKRFYKSLLKKVDEQIILSKTYYKGCMLARDRYMAEKADCLLGYCNKKTGGTAYTVKYFQKIHPDGEIRLLGK